MVVRAEWWWKNDGIAMLSCAGGGCLVVTCDATWQLNKHKATYGHRQYGYSLVWPLFVVQSNKGFNEGSSVKFSYGWKGSLEKVTADIFLGAAGCFR